MATGLVKSNIPSSTGSRSLKRKKEDDANTDNSVESDCKSDQSFDLYMLGAIGYLAPSRYHPVNEFQRYDFVRNEWTPLPNSTQGDRRTGFAVATRGHEIWLLGGRRLHGDGMAFATVYVYRNDIDGNRWRRGRRMAQEREGFCAAFVNDILYAFGGRSSRIHPGKSTAEVFAHGRWISGRKMNFARYDFATCVVGNNIFVVGGVSDAAGDSYVPQIEILNTTSGDWTIAVEMQELCRKSFALAHWNGRLYAIGGDEERTVIWNNSSGYGNWSSTGTNPLDLLTYDAFTFNGEIYVVGKTDDNVGSFRKLCMADHQWHHLMHPYFPWSGGVQTAILPSRRCKNAENAKSLLPAS